MWDSGGRGEVERGGVSRLEDVSQGADEMTQGAGKGMGAWVGGRRKKQGSVAYTDLTQPTRERWTSGVARASC